MPADLWPYLVIVLAGFLPNEVFRVAAVILARGVDERSEIFQWVRVVAVTLLAAVVSRLLYAPGAALATVPVSIRFLALAVGIGAFHLLRRSLIGAILTGEAVFIAIALALEHAR